MIVHGLVGAEPGRSDVVTAVVVPTDGVSRRPVRSGLDVQLWDPVTERVRPARLVRNLSGAAALLNEATDQELTFRIATGRTYYRGPVFLTVNPARDGISHVVALERRPEAPFDDVASLVRGVVVRSGAPGADGPLPVEGVRVTATVPGPGHQFPVTTDERGAFALAVSLRPPLADEPPTVAATLRVDKGGLPSRTLAVGLQHAHVHVFGTPVDLDGTGRVPFHHEPGAGPPGPHGPDQ